MRKFLIVLGIVALLLVGLTVPASAEETGEVSCSVTVQTISISLDITDVNYGTLAFTETATSATITATNDGNVAEDFNVTGANATVTGGPWTLSNTEIGTNQYMHSVTGLSPVIAETKLTTSAQTWATNVVATTGTQTFTTKIYMPDTGSSGAGEVASTTITLTAVEYTG